MLRAKVRAGPERERHGRERKKTTRNVYDLGLLRSVIDKPNGPPDKLTSISEESFVD